MKYGIVAFLLLVGSYISAQHTIKGVLVNSEGIGLEYANIATYRTNDESLYKVFLTSNKGIFEFELPSDKFNLVFSYVGYEEKRIPVENSEDLGNVILGHSAVQIEGVTVRASKPFIQRDQDKLIVNVENSILSTGNSALEVLQKSPGVVVDYNNNISMNGRSNLRIFIDGKDTQLNGDQLASLLEGMPASGIEKVEIISNPSARYEAEGNAGIIDIITKRGKLFGTNGSMTASAGMGHYFRSNGSLNLNHKNDKYNLYGQYSMAKRHQYMEIFADRIVLQDNTPSQILDMNTLFKLPISTHSLRVGMDYNLSKKSTLGILLTGFANLTGQESDANIDLYTGDNEFILSQNTDAETNTDWFQTSGNLNYSFRGDQGRRFTIDLDWAQYKNDGQEDFNSTFFDNDGIVLAEELLKGNIDGQLQLLGLSADYSQPLGKDGNLELGIKNTIVKNDNDLVYANVMNDQTTINTALSNHFIYDEMINAGYVIYAHSFSKVNVNIGLRMERTAIEGNQVTTGETFESTYVNWFPSTSFNYTFDPNNVLGLSISKRINRPSYQNLNPFRFFVNTYTYRVGNPLLIPENIWSYELNYTFKQRYHLSMSYGRSDNNLARAIFKDENENVVVSPVNIESLNTFGFNLSLPINILKRWSSNWNFSLSFNDYKGPVGGVQFDRLNTIFVLNTNHNIILGKGYSLQLGGFYLPPHWATVSKIEALSQITVGVQKSILQNRGRLRFSVNDIFYQGFPVGRTVLGNLDDAFISKRDSRYATLSFSLNFGKQTVRSVRPRRSSVRDEMNRARQGSS